MYKRIIRGISLSFVFIILGSFLAYLFRKILTSYLSVADYGLFFSVISFYSFFMLFIDLGLEPAATKLIVQYRLRGQEDKISSLSFSVFCFQFSLSLILYLIVYFLKDFLAVSYFHNPIAASALQFLGIWFLTAPFIIFIATLLLGYSRTTWYTALDFFRMLFLILISVFLFSQGKEIYAPLFAYLAINILLFLLYIPYVLSFIPSLFKKLQFNGIILKDVFYYGFFIAFTNFGWILISQTDTLVLTYFRSLTEVGLYNIALPLSLLLLFLMRPISIVFVPIVTELITEKKHKELQEAITLAYQYTFVFLLPFVLAFFAFSEYILSFLFSSSYIDAKYALIVLSFGTLFYAFSQFNSVIFTGLGKARYMASVAASIALLNLVLNVLLVPSLGILGAALSTSLSYIFLFLISCFYLRRFLPFAFPFSSWIYSLLLSGVIIALIFLLKFLLPWNNLFEAVLCGFILIFLYFPALYCFRIVDFKKLYHLFMENAFKS
ncbi:polysaccharide biosynthesis C-terminal domain-containing protein [Candidatus Woesearchaeota archaeon]|nr:polysaccharide biosynthesis C-terminal domain-containing protein [Candidatus Woesearchaeota archaeon]